MNAKLAIVMLLVVGLTLTSGAKKYAKFPKFCNYDAECVAYAEPPEYTECRPVGNCQNESCRKKCQIPL